MSPHFRLLVGPADESIAIDTPRQLLQLATRLETLPIGDLASNGAKVVNLGMLDLVLVLEIRLIADDEERPRFKYDGDRRRVRWGDGRYGSQSREGS